MNWLSLHTYNYKRIVYNLKENICEMFFSLGTQGDFELS